MRRKPVEAVLEPEMLTAPADILDPRHTALIIIDMQKDFCTPGFGADQAGRNLGPTRSIIPGLSRLLAAARAAGFWWFMSGSGPCQTI